MQLQKNSVRQAGTVSEIYEQQVLDNLARFVVNPYATPTFSIASQSTNGVADRGEFGISDGGFTGKFFAFLSAGGSRDAEQNFTLDPVANPQRLQLMQCAYQRAVGLQAANDCDKCCEYLVAWTGRVDACRDACGITSGWLCKSDCRKDVPKCCSENYGEFCGTYVWVDPCFRSEFSKLVMTIIEYAAGDPAESFDNVKVTYYIGEDNLPATKGNHVREIEAIVPRTALNEQQLLSSIPELSAQLAEKKQASAEAREVLSNDDARKDTSKVNAAISNIRKAFPNLALDDSALMESLSARNAEDNSETVVDKDIRSLQEQLDQAKREVIVIPSTGAGINFGPAAGSKGLFQNEILRQRQLLNTVPGR